jgi:hypothetical protein
LKDREQGQSGLTGLKMGNGGNQILNKDITSPLNQSSNSGSGQANPFLERRGMGTQNNPSSFILNPLLEKKPAVPQSGQSKQAEIDRKLEELQKRIKN